MRRQAPVWRHSILSDGLAPTALRRLAAANRECQNLDPSVLEGSPARKRKPLPAIRIGQFPITENPVYRDLALILVIGLFL